MSHCHRCQDRYCASKVGIFRQLTPEELEAIVGRIGRVECPRGETIVWEGDPAQALYIVNEGQVKLFTLTKEGKEQILYILGPGEFFGELSLLKEGVFTFGAQALTTAKLCTLSKAELGAVLLRNPQMSLKILEVVGERLTRLEGLVTSLASGDVEARISRLLLELADKTGVQTKEGVRIPLPLTREEMANSIGLTRETVSRRLNQLQDEGVLSLGPGWILVSDLQRVRDQV